MSEELARIETIKESPPDIFDACDLGLIDIIENLCSKQTIKLDEINSDGYTAPMLACKNGDIELIKTLCSDKCGADLNAAGMRNLTPLLIACNYGRVDIVRHLVSLDNIKKSCCDEAGNNALHYASMNGSIQNVDALITKANINVNSTNSNDTTPMMMAALFSRDTIIHELLKHSANVNKHDKDGNTALHIAAMLGSTAIIKLLLENGASKFTKNNDEKTPQDVAINQVIKQLLE